jgi:hypothetical protein
MGHNQNALFFLVLGGIVLYLQSKQSETQPAYSGLGPYPTYGPPAPPAGPCPAGQQWILTADQQWVCG